MLASLVAAAMLSVLASQPSCTSDVQAVYGDAIAGASGFAELLGVVCAGDCHQQASLWSTIARAHGDMSLTDAAACRSLCASTAGCEVFTFSAMRECYLMRKLSAGSAPALSFAAGNSSSPPLTTCVVESDGGVRDYGSQTFTCCAALENATAAIAAGGAAVSYIDNRLCGLPACAAALRTVLGPLVPESVCSAPTSCPDDWGATSSTGCHRVTTATYTLDGCPAACASMHDSSYPACITDNQANGAHGVPTPCYWGPWSPHPIAMGASVRPKER